jgi:branched-chain amino acid aminotransferase
MGSFAAVDDWVGPTAEARLSVLDNGFVFGDGVYETLRTYAGRPFHLDRHLDRLRRSSARLGFDVSVSDAELTATLDRVLDGAANDESFIRIIASRGVGDISYRFERVQGPTVVIVAKPLEPLPEDYFSRGVPVAITTTRRNAANALDPAIKSCNLLNNILAVREAQSQGAIEGLLLNAAGHLAEGASSNFFVVNDGRLLTPPLSAGILAGITRDVVLTRAAGIGFDAKEIPLTPDDLLSADEAFLTSTLKEVMPIATVDGSPIGDGRPGPITWRVLEDFREYARAHSR